MHDQSRNVPRKAFSLLGAAGALALLAVGVGIGTGFSVFDHGKDAAVTAKIEAEAQDRKAARPEQFLPLTHPICTATMTTSVAGVVDQRGCYSPKGER